MITEAVRKKRQPETVFQTGKVLMKICLTEVNIMAVIYHLMSVRMMILLFVLNARTPEEKDEGTYSGDIYEKDITLAVVNYMNELLEDEGIHVILTRSSDTYMKLKKRTDMANNAGVDFVCEHTL